MLYNVDLPLSYMYVIECRSASSSFFFSSLSFPLLRLQAMSMWVGWGNKYVRKMWFVWRSTDILFVCEEKHKKVAVHKAAVHRAS